MNKMNKKPQYPMCNRTSIIEQKFEFDFRPQNNKLVIILLIISM